MKFWYRVHPKQRGRWRRKVEFGIILTEDEVELNPKLHDLPLPNRKFETWSEPRCGISRYHHSTTSIAIRDLQWFSTADYVDAVDVPAWIDYVLAIRNAILTRIDEARAMEPEPEIYVESDSGVWFAPANGPARRIRLKELVGA